MSGFKVVNLAKEGFGYEGDVKTMLIHGGQVTGIYVVSATDANNAPCFRLGVGLTSTNQLSYNSEVYNTQEEADTAAVNLGKLFGWEF